MGWGKKTTSVPPQPARYALDYAPVEVMSKSRVKRLEATAPHLVPRCSECGEPQSQTPSGMVCKNGHGGVEELEAHQPSAAAKAEGEWAQFRSRKGWVPETVAMVLYEFVKDRGLFPDLLTYAKKRK